MLNKVYVCVCVCMLRARKIFKLLVRLLLDSVQNTLEKFTAWRVNSTLNFTRKADIARIAKISVFQVKFNVEFTCQAVNFS